MFQFTAILISISGLITLNSGSPGDPALDKHPCEIVTLEDVKNLFGLSLEQVTVDRGAGVFPSCGYNWDGGRKRTMKIGTQEIEVDAPNEVLLVVVEGKATTDMYERSISSYTDELQPLDIGDQAVWSDRRKQTTVLYNGHLFHVHIDCFSDDTENMQMAVRLAELVIEKAY